MASQEDRGDAPLLSINEKERRETVKGEDDKDAKKLILYFLLMVFFGCANRIFSVLQLIPLHNYSLFSNLLTTFVYIPTSFAYVFVVFSGLACKGAITDEARAVPLYKWAVMGTLDSIAGIMQIMATALIADGTLVTLLLQAAIPISMAISKCFLKTKYRQSQYVGAGIVAVGLIVTLLPTFLQHQSEGQGSNRILWSIVIIFSCVPMAFSSVYKEKALGSAEIDAIYMNGWVAVFQFILSFPLLVPGAVAAKIPVSHVWDNLWNGMKCFAGVNTYTNKHTLPNDNFVVDNCSAGPLYTSLYVLCNLAYNVLIILLLKYGSANILFLALTAVVPVASIAFAIPGMPQQQTLTWGDWVGLVLIMSGLVCYRFFPALHKAWKKRQRASGKRHYSQAELANGRIGDGGLDDSGLDFDALEEESPKQLNTPLLSGAGHAVHVSKPHRHLSGEPAGRAQEAPY